MLLVGFCGQIGMGKTTAAQYLVDKHGFVRSRFAEPLKNMIRCLGVTDEHLDGPPEARDLPLEVLGGRSARWAMQTLGTEWGRMLIHPDLWVKVWYHSIKDKERVVVDDVRFENEADLIKDLGGTILRIRRGTSYYTKYGAKAHASEEQDFEYDAEVWNDGSMAQLHAQLEARLAAMLGTPI